VTVNSAALVAVPPAVVIVILPVTAPAGTVAVTLASDTTANVVAFTPPNATFDICDRLTPLVVHSFDIVYNFPSQR
jgi:hypothetical protein